jgi:hypothetical protein
MLVERWSSNAFGQFSPPQRQKEIALHVRKFFAGDRVTGHQNDVQGLGQITSMQTENLPQQTPSTASLHGATDFFAGDHSDATVGAKRARR